MDGVVQYIRGNYAEVQASLFALRQTMDLGTMFLMLAEPCFYRTWTWSSLLLLMCIVTSFFVCAVASGDYSSDSTFYLWPYVAFRAITTAILAGAIYLENLISIKQSVSSLRHRPSIRPCVSTLLPNYLPCLLQPWASWLRGHGSSVGSLRSQCNFDILMEAVFGFIVPHDGTCGKW